MSTSLVAAFEIVLSFIIFVKWHTSQFLSFYGVILANVDKARSDLEKLNAEKNKIPTYHINWFRVYLLKTGTKSVVSFSVHLQLGIQRSRMSEGEFSMRRLVQEKNLF